MLGKGCRDVPFLAFGENLRMAAQFKVYQKILVVKCYLPAYWYVYLCFSDNYKYPCGKILSSPE